jgi:hypothetical protein
MNKLNQKLFSAISGGFQLVPLFVSGIQTLFGKGNGASKKDAVINLVNASIVGSAIGFSAAGDDTIAQALSAMQPAISAAIDQAVAAFKSHGHPAFVETPTSTPGK